MPLYRFWFGPALVKGGTVENLWPFPSEPAELARRLDQICRGERTQEESEALSATGEVGVLLPPPEVAATTVEAALAKGFTPALRREAVIHLAGIALSRIGPDIHIIQAVEAADELAKVVNLMDERLAEWEGYAGDAGAGPDHLRASRDRAVESRKALEEYLRTQMASVAPSLAGVVGPVLGARLISAAGGLHRLARMPAGTIQVLGAERALFRHLRDGKKGPKHGLLFQHPLVHRAAPKERGRAARSMSGKAAIAARMDFYSPGGGDRSGTLSAHAKK